MVVKQVTDGVVWMNGRNLVGQADEVKLPEIGMKMVNHAGLGSVGELELPSKLEKLQLDIKWKSFFGDVFRNAFNPFVPCVFQIRSSISGWDSINGVSKEIPLVTHITATCKKFALGELKSGDPASYPTEWAVQSLKQIEDGKDVIEIDLMANIFKVDGKPVRPQFNANLGI